MASFSRWICAALVWAAAASMPVAAAAAQLPWFDNFSDGYVEAVKSGRAAVVVFTSGGEHADDLIAAFNGSARFYTLTTKAVFIVTDVSRDRAGYNIASDVHIDKLPSVSVFEPRANLVKEVYRVTGYHDAAELFQRLDPAIEQTFAAFHR